MWIITTDHIESGAVGTRSPDYVNRNMAQKFRLLDGDANLCYTGFASALSFDPLDDFGRPNAGATVIEFWNSKTEQWEQL